MMISNLTLQNGYQDTKKGLFKECLKTSSTKKTTTKKKPVENVAVSPMLFYSQIDVS